MTTVILADTPDESYGDARRRFLEAHLWSSEHCESYTGYDIVEVADLSTAHDLMCEYRFEDERDLVFFRLRWS